MKKLLIFSVMFIGMTVAALAQCGSTAVLSGCVGACGSPYDGSYTVTAADVGPGGIATFCLSATGNSLCPNTTAEAILRRNNQRQVRGTLSAGDVLRITAREGDVLTVHVDLGAGDRNIICVWQGETHFSLFR